MGVGGCEIFSDKKFFSTPKLSTRDVTAIMKVNYLSFCVYSYMKSILLEISLCLTLVKIKVKFKKKVMGDKECYFEFDLDKIWMLFISMPITSYNH